MRATKALKTTAKATGEARPTETVDGYLAALPGNAKARLSELRRCIHKAVAGLEEGLTYQIPVFRLDGRQIVSMGAAKSHCSLYVLGNDAVLQQYRVELKNYEIGKGVVKFPLDKPIPGALVTKLVRAAAATKQHPI